MFLQRSSRAVRSQWHVYQGLSRFLDQGVRSGAYAVPRHGFHSSQRMQVVKPVLLADIGEGIVECEIIQWFVEPDARVEEFSPLCEVQSDKASVEITSRFAGVVKKLYYDAGEMAKVGKPFVDIDIQGDVKKEDLEALTAPEPSQGQGGAGEPMNKENLSKPPESQSTGNAETKEQVPAEQAVEKPRKPNGRFASLATPAVRHVSKELDVDITDIEGTGKDGRVLKEDIYKYVEARKSPSAAPSSSGLTSTSDTATQTETPVQLTNIQTQMFKTMTRSLNIPHFLYTDEIDFSQIHTLRARLNKVLASSPEGDVSKLSYLPFIIKAVSLAIYQYPVLNARVDVDSATQKPSLIHRSQHNIGIAMDTPSGLLVPVIKNVASRNILSIASELTRLQAAATAGKLSPQDLTGGTITVSNIGNIGGTYLSPVIVEKEVAIMGVGRMRTVPAFDENEKLVKKQVCNFSWSADHRVVDGATMARAAEVVRRLVEEPDVMVMHLR
ncbi:putative Dihydrolipoamide acetyltransferase component of pyruvate dehydrogenase complex [Seiridium cardinale]|uniref:Dihydrolipoamide acetyltransferase component of pyruvate dehydrogenase complex n=1 Tax=Seiridium cardinale TaxID=138064 RepID=A0ABR2X6E5_9PEZI